MSGTIVWRAKGGFIEGVTLRRPKISAGDATTVELLRIEGKGKLNMVQSVLDNEGSSGDVVRLSGEGGKGRWESCLFQNGVRGILLHEKAELEITQVCIRGVHSFLLPLCKSIHFLTLQTADQQCIVSKNRNSGFVCLDEAELMIDACAIQKNGNHGVALHNKSRASITRSRFLSNKGQVVKKESSSCSASCSANVCTKSASVPAAPPGFQFVTK